MDVEEKQLWNWNQSEGGHYSKPVPCLDDTGMEALRAMFPDGEANAMNFVLFSTSGVHGSYQTIEEEEGVAEESRTGITFLIVQPRLVALRYGKAKPKSEDDFAYLKKLRSSSHSVVSEIGA